LGLLSNAPPSGGPISGRAGTTAPRVSTDISIPTQTDQEPGVTTSAPKPTPTYTAPSYGSYALPTGPADEGPPDGLTIDQAIDRMIRENLDLRSKSLEIPQAKADILNAGLRANPVFYADGQLVPYGRYTKVKPGGQTQYDVNVSYPLDLSHKRQARTLFAARAESVVEAQYQDAVRSAIDQLYTLYLNVLAARQTVAYARKSVEGFTQLHNVTKLIYERDQKTRADVARVKAQLEGAEIGLVDAMELLRQAKRDLGVVLNLPPDQSETFDLRGTILDLSPPPPPVDELIRLALLERPDVVSFRLGIRTAEANVRLQLANRYPDVYMLYQPYTLQDNTPYGLKSPISWALGVTVPLPVYNRNQGGIARAKLNVTQSQLELETIERQVITDVQKALYEYQVTHRMVDRVRDVLEPNARLARDDTKRLFEGGEVDVVAFLSAQREYQDIVKQYLDTLVRHRRSMLALNTVLGRRIFP
jgi:cobalt-zinc-cadmium efflux system outer membrane protein